MILLTNDAQAHESFELTMKLLTDDDTSMNTHLNFISNQYCFDK